MVLTVLNQMFEVEQSMSKWQMRLTQNFRGPIKLMGLTFVPLEHQPRHIGGVLVYQLALLGKETVECLWSLKEEEGKTIEIIQAEIDLIKPPGSVDFDAFSYLRSHMNISGSSILDGVTSTL